MKKLKYLCIIVVLLILMELCIAGCNNKGAGTANNIKTESAKEKGKLSKTQKNFMKERGFNPTDLPKATVIDIMNMDGIDIKFYSQFGIIDTSGAICFTSQYMDSEDGIDQIEAYYYFMWQELDEIAVPNVKYLDIVTIDDKDYLYEDGINGIGNLYYPVDDNHFMKIQICCVEHYDKDATMAMSVKSIRELMDEDNFAEMIKFEIEGAGELSKDIYSYGEIDLDSNIYIKEPLEEDVVTEDSITYVKNQLLISTQLNTDRQLLEELGDKYGFEIVGCIEITSDYQVEFAEDKKLDELNKISAELEALEWVSACTLNYVDEITVW